MDIIWYVIESEVSWKEIQLGRDADIKNDVKYVGPDEVALFAFS